MATINAFIRTSKGTKAGKEVNVRFRLTDGRGVSLAYTSDIKILPEHFDTERQLYKSRVSNVSGKKVYEVNSAITELKQRIERVYNERHPRSSAELKMWLCSDSDTDTCTVEYDDFFDLFDRFLLEKKRTSNSIKNYHTLYNCLKRFEAYKRIILSPNLIDKSFVLNFEDYVLNEWKIVRKHDGLLNVCSESRAIEKRSLNTVAKQLKNLSAFMNWLVVNGYMRQNPLLGMQKPTQVYGTPFFLSIMERDKLYAFDFASVGRPQLNMQRDVFVFQCLIGCRVSDLQRLTRANVRDGFIEYIADKTINERPRTIRVPLSKTAQEILERYCWVEKPAILPQISSQRYNDAIKDMLRLAGIDRMVTILDPLTRREISKPIYEVASSHMARRTFIGNLYNKVKDPNLISSMSGHADGSRAFARYRAIDDDIKRSVIELLE